MRRSEDFRLTVRRGRKAATASLVVHRRDPAAVGSSVDFPTVGFIVTKAVGSAVVRNGVKRRLRHLIAARIGLLGPGAQVVVRALPASANRRSVELAADLDRALAKVAS